MSQCIGSRRRPLAFTMNFSRQSGLYARKCNPKNVVVCITVVCFLVLLIYMYTSYVHRFEVNPLHLLYRQRVRDKYEAGELLERAWLDATCYRGHFVPSLASLEDNLHWLGNSSDDRCKALRERFANMYDVSPRRGTLRIPPKFYPRVVKWLNGDAKLLAQLNSQYALHLYNVFAMEHAVFSPLRAKRPHGPPSVDAYEYTKKFIADSAKDCDFCRFETSTSEDVFGRIVTARSATASNTFKMDEWHGLVFPKKHSLLELDEEDVVDMFRTAETWFKKVNSIDPKFRYPWILWDAMPHAGASQVHPHIQVGLGKTGYVGIYEVTRHGAYSYHERYGRNYFGDLVELHATLGLTLRLGKAVALAQLTSRKDTEVTVIGPSLDDDFSRLVFYTMKAFNDMGLYGFSSLTVLPDMKNPESRKLMPAIMRISSRGDVAAVRSEISTFELYQFANLNVDPYDVIRILNHSLTAKQTTSPLSFKQ